MRSSYIALSVLHLFVSIFFIAAGFLLFRIFHSEELFLRISAWIFNHPALLKTFGLILAFFGMVLLASVGFLNRKRYYEVLLTPSSKYTIQTEVLKAYIQNYWMKNLKQNEESIKEVYLDRTGNLHITASMQHLRGEAQLESLEKLEKELTDLLNKKIGFKQTISLKIYSSEELMH